MKYWYCLIVVDGSFRFFRANSHVEAFKKYSDAGGDINNVPMYSSACSLEECWSKTSYLIKPGAPVIVKTEDFSVDDLLFYTKTIVPVIGKKAPSLICGCGSEAPYGQGNQPDGSFQCYKCRNKII